MKPVKIVAIGAGSMSFGLNTMAHLIACEKLHGSTLALVDVNAEGLSRMKKLAGRMNSEWGASMKIMSSTRYRKMLPDADFVILSVAVDREKCWRKDYEIGLRHGIHHYAENGGPGGFSQTARNLELILPILRDIEKLCPNAWVINFTNPVPRICLAAQRYSAVKMVGICHQIEFGYGVVGMVLASDLGIDTTEILGATPSHEEEVWPQMMKILSDAHGLMDIKAAGTNHNTWMLDLRRKGTGEDLYPLFARRIRTVPPHWQPLSRKLFDLFVVYPIPGDGHLAEYLPWVSDAKTKPWKRFNLPVYDFKGSENYRRVV